METSVWEQPYTYQNNQLQSIARIAGIDALSHGHRCPRPWAMNAQTAGTKLGNVFLLFVSVD